MTARSSRLLGLLVLQLALAILPMPVDAGNPAAFEPREYTAVYEVSRNGETVANITLELAREGDDWTYTGFTHDMQGLGKLLQVEGRQAVTGAWRDGQFEPRTYTFSFGLVGYRSHWQADFDWAAGAVTTGKKSKQTTLSLARGAMDPMSLMLNTGSMLSAGWSELEVEVIDGDKIESHSYRARPGLWLETALGCARTTQVERLRKNDKRQSTAWYAEDAAYIPVRLQHLKKGGSDLQVGIVALLFDGRETVFSAACPAEGLQTAGD